MGIGKKLIEERSRKGLTQEELAKACNLNVRTIQRIESGSVKPRFNTIRLLAGHLDVDFHKFNYNGSSQTVFWHVKDLFNLKAQKVKKLSILGLMAIAILFGTFKIANAISKSPAEATGMIITRFGDDVFSGDVKHKAFINFFQLDENNRMQLVDKLRFREDILIPARGIDFSKPVVVNYYVEVENEEINGDCHTIIAKNAKNCELQIILGGDSTSLEVLKLGKEEEDPKLLKGIHFDALDNEI